MGVHGIVMNQGVTPDGVLNRNENDYYATPPYAVEKLLEYELFNSNILEPCVGGGHISNFLENRGYNVTKIDIIDRGVKDTQITDFLKYTQNFDGDIITNPPYEIVTDFVNQCLSVATGKVALLLKLQFLETISRYNKIFEIHPPHRMYIFVKRVACGRGGVFNTKGSAVCYCWYVWDESKNIERKPTEIYWIPNHKKGG